MTEKHKQWAKWLQKDGITSLFAVDEVEAALKDGWKEKEVITGNGRKLNEKEAGIIPQSEHIAKANEARASFEEKQAKKAEKTAPKPAEKPKAETEAKAKAK